MPGIIVFPKPKRPVKKIVVVLVVFLGLLGFLGYKKYLGKSMDLKSNTQILPISTPQLNLSDPNLKKTTFLGKVSNIDKDKLFIYGKKLPLNDQTICFYGTPEKKAKVDCSQIKIGDQVRAETLQISPDEEQILATTTVYFTH